MYKIFKLLGLSSLFSKLFLLTQVLLAQAFLLNPTHAAVIESEDWNVTPTISGANGDNSLTQRQVIEGRIDANTSESRFTGVVSLQIRKNGRTYICTGTAISQKHILSAAHCADTNGNGTVIDLSQPNTYINAIFNHDGDSSAVISAEAVEMHEDYEGFNICPDSSTGCLQDDIAVITLSENIPDGVEIYDFYSQTVRSTGFIQDGDVFTMVGYGTRGDGFSGHYTSSEGSPTWTEKLVGGNIVDLLRTDDEGGLWDEVWYADFDGHNGVLGQDIDTLCGYGICSSWLDESIETMIGGGDSGGPSFIYNSITDEYLLAGINTFGAHGYVDNKGAFGDLFGGILVNPYVDWINDIVSSSLPTNSQAISAPSVLSLFGGLFFSLILSRRKKLNCHNAVI